jgi:hypothetical protein
MALGTSRTSCTLIAYKACPARLLLRIALASALARLRVRIATLIDEFYGQ